MGRFTPESLPGLTRRRLLAGGGVTAAAAGAALLNPLAATAAPVPGGARLLAAKASGAGPASQNTSFITRSGTSLLKDGQPWRFGGTNTYYLHYESHYMIDSALDNAGQLGLPVVRAWAHSDGPNAGVTLPMQPAPFTYDEAAFDSLDYAVWKAGQLGIRLILVLTNNWDNFGGMPQYVKWWHPDLADDSTGDATGNTPNHDLFYTDANIKATYFAWVRHAITRKNRYTRLAYNEDPTVMTWDLANEPRNRSAGTQFGTTLTDGQPLTAWVDEASQHVKALAPHQLIAIGDDGIGLDHSSTDYPYSGFEGTDWVNNTAAPALDYGTLHLYPTSFGETTDPTGWGSKWITDHATAAAALGKPVLLEEFGTLIGSTDVPDTAARDATYQTWMATAASTATATGFTHWLLTALQDDGTLYPDFDGYRVTYPSSTASAVQAGAAAMAAAAAS